ncbi:AAA-like domain-containing protein [Microcoleus sp. ZQ-A2]|nr:AAA-like domain-containing protein [Microcoleus sp. FACHB-1]
MYTELRSLYEYQVGGSLPLEAPTYVTRQADADLYRGVKAGQFCYVLNSRQTGKSSLRVRTMQRLQAEGMICAVVDLTAIGNQNIPADQWYAGVTYTLASSFNLLDQVDIGTWWCDREFLPPVQRLSEFIREVLFKKIHQNLAIFVDEIDSVLALDFPINDFFSLIRSCYNNRAEHPEYKRLNWILLGVANPSNLIDSAPNSTPFNIGCAIELTEFKQHQLQPLSQGLVDITPNPDAAIQEVLNWTGGQPFLTQKLCKLILQEAGVRSQESGAFLSDSQSQMPNPKSQIAEWIENLVRSHVLENWEMTDEPEHLRTIRNRLLKSGWRILGLLGLYQEILQQGEVPANDSAEQVELRLSGLVVKQEGKLKVYNRIYQSVFNLSWVEKTLANWRHYDSSLIAWKASNRKNKLYFLSGQILQDALAWTTDKSLSDRDEQFLTASQQKANERLTQEEESLTERLFASHSTRSSASRYWTLVSLDATGKRRIQEIASAKAFFLASFPEFATRREVPHSQIQYQLLSWMRETTEADTDTQPEPEKDVTGTQTASRRDNKGTRRSVLARRCLQCFISSQIERVCLKLEGQFGTQHGFTCSDLLCFVLDEQDTRQPRGKTTATLNLYQSLSQEILQKFDPQQSSLATWTTRLVKHHRELNQFLLEHGVYLISDWAILNDTTTKQLERIFSQFYCLTSLEIEQAKLLLESYHAVYRVQRLKQRQSGIKGQCAPLTTEQLQQIAQRFSYQTSKLLRPETLLTKLHNMASHLRNYRIHVRGGFLPTKPIDVSMAPNSSHATTERLLLHSLIDDRNTIDLETEFLDSYRQQFLACLDHAIADITEQRVRKLQRKDPEKAQKFLTALKLFHGRGKSMGEIAKQVNLNAQFHVSRLLQLKSFRADIQQQFLILLRDRVINTAKVYTDPERLQSLSQQIEEALEEQVTKVIEDAATEASIPTGTKNQTLSTSLFSERLCRYLDRLK